MAKINPFVNETIRINAGYEQLIIIDNKEINDLIKRGRETSIQKVSGAVEAQLAKKLGFKGAGTDVSGKSDFQQFSLVVNGEKLANPSSVTNPQAQRFLEALKGTALGETYDIPSKVSTTRGRTTGPDPEGTTVGGLGAELKLKKEVIDIDSLIEGGSLPAQSGVTLGGLLSGGAAPFNPQDVIKFRDEAKRGGGNVGQLFGQMLQDQKLASQLFENPQVLKRLDKKTRNVFLLASFKLGKKTINTLYFMKDFKPLPGDIVGSTNFSKSSAKREIQWKYTNNFETRLIKRVLQLFGDDLRGGLTDKTTQNALGILSLSDDLKGMEITAPLNTVSSIPIPAVARIKVPKIKEAQATPGRFISSAQLTQILQARIRNRMPKIGPPSPSEGLKYRTGRFVESLRFTINYRNALINYYSEPPVNEYFDKFHRRPYAVGQRLIRPTIREFVQEAFGRQFRIIKT